MGGGWVSAVVALCTDADAGIGVVDGAVLDSCRTLAHVGMPVVAGAIKDAALGCASAWCCCAQCSSEAAAGNGTSVASITGTSMSIRDTHSWTHPRRGPSTGEAWNRGLGSKMGGRNNRGAGDWDKME